MRFFTCLLDVENHGISESTCRAYGALPRRRGLHFQWQASEGMQLLTAWDDDSGGPMLSRSQGGDWIAVGMARLDNREEVRGCVERADAGDSDLSLIRCGIARHGERFVSRLLGDFAFVVWNGRTRVAVAACDAFAVQRLYYAKADGLVAFASRAEALARRDEYDLRYLAELISHQKRSDDLSVYAGVRQVPRASMAQLHGPQLTVGRYWEPAGFAIEEEWSKAEHEVIAKCHSLMVKAVRQRMGGARETWAQLSGGIDSSSVVSCIQLMAGTGQLSHGLAGTVTFVDRHGTGTDEREYSNAVVNQWQVPNTAIIDPPTWFDATLEPPQLDQPRGDLHVYPRDRKLCAIVRAAGGRVLLTGSGGDELFSGTMLFFADWLARGKVWRTVREMARRAALGRVSFWELAYRTALLPLLPRVTHSMLVHDQDEMAVMPWLKPAMMRQFGIRGRHAMTEVAYGGRFGHKYHHAVVDMVAKLECQTHGGVLGDSLDVRHPFLYRPLVEFALKLPPQLRARPHAHRWVLRQAMRGVLPEKVRTRVGKPGTAQFLDWSLTVGRAHLSPLLREPVLADLGLVEPSRLRLAFQAALQHSPGSEALCGPLLHTLTVEAWLQLRSGRWPCGIRSCGSN